MIRCWSGSMVGWPFGLIAKKYKSGEEHLKPSHGQPVLLYRDRVCCIGTSNIDIN